MAEDIQENQRLIGRLADAAVLSNMEINHLEKHMLIGEIAMKKFKALTFNGDSIFAGPEIPWQRKRIVRFINQVIESSKQGDVKKAKLEASSKIEKSAYQRPCQGHKRGASTANARRGARIAKKSKQQ